MAKEVSPGDLIKDLRELLSGSAKQIPAELRGEVSRKINLLSIQFPGLGDQGLALASIAVIGVAAMKGDKDAKRKALKFANWMETPPPSLSGLASDLERRGAVRMLASHRAAWIPDYACGELFVREQLPQLATDLASWAYTRSESAANILTSLAKAVTGSSGIGSDRLKLIGRLVLKNLSKSRVECGAGCPAALEGYAVTLREIAGRQNLAHTDLAMLQEHILDAVDLLTAQEPAILLNAATIQTIGVAGAIGSGWSAPSRRRLAKIGNRMLSVGALVVTWYGVNNSNEARSILGLAAEVLPLEKLATRFRDDRESLRSLLKGAEGAVDADTGNAAGYQDHVAGLLVAWNNCLSSVGNLPGASELRLQIEAVAAAASVEVFGETGKVVAYQPLEHTLAERGVRAPVSVKIEVPGVRARREDGSYRVIVKAVVSPAK